MFDVPFGKKIRSRVSSHSMKSREEQTAIRIHQQQARQQHKRQQGTPTTSEVPEPLETPVSDGMLTTSGTPDTTGISGDANSREA